MSRPRVEDMQRGFAGGLNVAADSSQMGDNEVRRAENARLTEYGAIKMRLGTKRMHTTSLGSINGGFAWMQPTNSYHFVAANGVIKTAPLGSAPLSWTSLTGAIASSGIVDFAAFRDGSGEKVYIADGGPLNKATNAALTVNLAGTPNVVSLAVYNQRLYGVDGVTQNIYASAINNGDSLGIPGSDGVVAIIRTFGDQECFAVKALRSSLAIFHRSGISRFTGLTVDDIDIEAGVQGFSEQVGTIAKRSLVAVEGEVYFFSEQGFYKLSETGLEAISLKIDPVTRAIEADVIPRIIGAHNKLRHEVWWYIPDVGVYVYNYVLKAWSGPFTGTYRTSGIRAMWNTEAAGSLPSQVFIGSTDGFVRLCDDEAGLDDVLSDGTGGSDKVMTVQCHRMFFGDEAQEKALRKAYVLCDLKGSTGAYARWKTNSGTTDYTFSAGAVDGEAWGTGTWGAGTWGGSEVGTFQLQGSGRGQSYDFFLYDDGHGETTFSRVRLEAFQMTRR